MMGMVNRSIDRPLASWPRLPAGAIAQHGTSSLAPFSRTGVGSAFAFGTPKAYPFLGVNGNQITNYGRFAFVRSGGGAYYATQYDFREFFAATDAAGFDQVVMTLSGGAPTHETGVYVAQYRYELPSAPPVSVPSSSAWSRSISCRRSIGP